MATTETLQVTVTSTGLFLRTPRGDVRPAELPALPDDEEFSLDVACLALDIDSPNLDDATKQRLVEHLAQSGGTPIRIARRLGERLFDLLFPSQEFAEGYRLARDAGDGLRLVLEFAFDPQDPNPMVSQWAALPWEYLLDPKVPER